MAVQGADEQQDEEHEGLRGSAVERRHQEDAAGPDDALDAFHDDEGGTPPTRFLMFTALLEKDMRDPGHEAQGRSRDGEPAQGFGGRRPKAAQGRGRERQDSERQGGTAAAVRENPQQVEIEGLTVAVRGEFLANLAHFGRVAPALRGLLSVGPMPTLDDFRGHLFHQPTYSPTTPDRSNNAAETLMRGSRSRSNWTDAAFLPLASDEIPFLREVSFGADVGRDVHKHA